MKKSYITVVGGIIKKITGIENIALFRKKIKKNVGKIIYHKKYTAQDIVSIMQDMGMKKGSVVCVHSSMREFYNYKGNAEDLIDAILQVITEEGTLVMPCFPKKNLVRDVNYIFSKKDPTGAGYLSEVFRKHPDVERSINVQHSVAAWGKYAKWLISDHQNCDDCWDINSPWRRMLELNALVFNFGLPRSFMGTFRHCLESTLKTEHPYWAQFFTKEEEFRYYDENNCIKNYTSKTKEFERRNNSKYQSLYFDNEDWQIKKISNLEIKVFYTEKCFPKMLELGRKGISPYFIPSTKGYNF